MMIDDIIAEMKTLYNIDRFRFNSPVYESFHKKLTDFVYQNHFDNTNEWEKISKNLLYHSSQVMLRSEADEIMIQLELLKRRTLTRSNEEFWQYIHPMIKALVFKKFYDEHYADCVETAFKEINSRLKKIYRKERNEEKDGSDLMRCTFSFNNPLLKFEDNSTSSGENVQKGYMDIFAGAMTGIRNPKAHENQTITKDAAIKRLIFGSLLMDKIDAAVQYSNIVEVS